MKDQDSQYSSEQGVCIPHDNKYPADDLVGPVSRLFDGLFRYIRTAVFKARFCTKDWAKSASKNTAAAVTTALQLDRMKATFNDSRIVGLSAIDTTSHELRT